MAGLAKRRAGRLTRLERGHMGRAVRMTDLRVHLQRVEASRSNRTPYSASAASWVAPSP